ncbi:MAG: hypothetical protein ACK55I_43900, partial [bacterium]
MLLEHHQRTQQDRQTGHRGWLGLKVTGWPHSLHDGLHRTRGHQVAPIEDAGECDQWVLGRHRARAEYEGGDLLSRECEVVRCRGVRIGAHEHAVAQRELPDARVAFNGERERLAYPLGLAWIDEVAQELQVLVHGCRDECLRGGCAQEATDRVERQRLTMELH